MAESRYDKYVLRGAKVTVPVFPKKDMLNIGFDQKYMEKLGKVDINFNFVSILSPHVLADPPHNHNCDEYLFFIPASSENWPELGAEAEIAMGEEWEKHTINTAAIICLPAGVQHAPIFMKKVDKPFYFGHCLLADSYGSSQFNGV
ncbi:MAG: hypothetical protein JW927_02335 [Deltaproteobacteria bacterium]|nr:hypothetical protein [Deltaproteobacteria bacterium]